VNDEIFQEKPILIFANKQDLPNAMDCDQLRNKLNLYSHLPNSNEALLEYSVDKN
jgi:signal recognition particle receptor subunit beta